MVGAHGRDVRPVIAERDTKSVSAEETFDVDLSDPAEMAQAVAHLAARVAARLAAGGLFGRTVTLKLRRADFTTITRAATTAQPSAGIAGAALQLLAQVGAVGGVRLLGVSVSALSGFSQPDLFWAPAPAGGHAGPAGPAPAADEPPGGPPSRVWATGMDVVHATYGPGWVWGAGRAGVSVRFEGPGTPPGPVRTFAGGDPDLSPAAAPNPGLATG